MVLEWCYTAVFIVHAQHCKRGSKGRVLLLEGLEGQLGVVTLLGGRQAIKLSQARMDLVQVVPPFSKDPAFFDLIHGPDFVNVFRQPIADCFNVSRQGDLQNVKLERSN